MTLGNLRLWLYVCACVCVRPWCEEMSVYVRPVQEHVYAYVLVSGSRLGTCRSLITQQSSYPITIPWSPWRHQQSRLCWTQWTAWLSRRVENCNNSSGLQSGETAIQSSKLICFQVKVCSLIPLCRCAKQLLNYETAFGVFYEGGYLIPVIVFQATWATRLQPHCCCVCVCVCLPLYVHILYVCVCL